MKHKYDIFISYRRTGTGDKAEHLLSLLTPIYGPCISFDRENLTGVFDVELIKRIDHCQDFLLVLGKHSLSFSTRTIIPKMMLRVHPDWSQEKAEGFAKHLKTCGQEEYEAEVRSMGYDPVMLNAFSESTTRLYEYLGSCSQEEFERKIREIGHTIPLDFVRIEIARALHRKGLNIIPIVPEGTDQYNFNSLNLPPDIAGIQHYEAIFFSDNPDALFKDVLPKIRKHLHTRESRRKWWWGTAIAAVLLAACSIIAGLHINHEHERHALMTDSVGAFQPSWAEDITFEQLKAVHEMLSQMEPVEGGTFLMGAPMTAQGECDEEAEPELETPQVEVTVPSFFMGRYEVSRRQWCSIMKEHCDEADGLLPMGNVTHAQCRAFCDTLYNLTGLRFDLPTEAEWEYAARGGNDGGNFRYAGSDTPQEVAWYAANAKGKPHPCDATNSDKHCNALNIFDMSGNVAEWCKWTTPTLRLLSDMHSGHPSSDVIYNQGLQPVRGGSYLSQPYEITVFHRDALQGEGKAAVCQPNIGLRLVVRDN